MPAPLIPDHTLICRIGAGAYGEVWLARSSLGTLRAVKIVRHADFDDDRPYEREFAGLQKFEPLSRTHEGFVDLLHVGRNDAEGWFYYVMELADDAGAPLTPSLSLRPTKGEGVRRTGEGGDSQLSTPDPLNYSPLTLAALVKSRGALPLDECLAIARTLTSALAELHRHGLVHRDIKPSNIVFVGGVPKLADVGLVAAARGVGQDRSFVGTEGFIPPEGPGTPAADLYSLGIVLYVLGTGQSHRDFPEPPADLASQPDRERERWLEFSAVIHRACQADPRDRYASAAELLTDVERLAAGGSVRRHRAWRQWARFGKRLALAAAFAAALAWLLMPRFNPPSRPPSTTLAVFPFDVEGTQTGDDLSARLTEEIRAGLARVPGLGVIGRETSETFKDRPDRLYIARTNQVNAVLEGRLRRWGERFSLSLELIDTRSGRLLWSLPSTEGAVSNRFGFQLRAMQEIPDALKLKLTESDRVKLAAQPTRSLPALQAYWEGRHVWESWDKPGRMEKALELFQTATREDPDYAPAYCEIVYCYVGLAQGRSWKQHRDAARAAAQKALELAPDLADSHIASAFIKWGDYDWSGAETDFRRALQLNPLHARGCVWFANFFEESGRFDEAGKFRRRAVELDPLSDMTLGHIGNQLVREGRLEDALAQYEKAGRSSRDLGMQWPVAETFRALKRDAEALDAYERAMLGWNVSRDDLAALRSGFQRSGWAGYWQVRLQQIGPDTSAFERARLNALAGHTNEMFALLDQSVADFEAPAPRIIYDDAFKPYRSDPRFQDLLRRMNLEP